MTVNKLHKFKVIMIITVLLVLAFSTAQASQMNQSTVINVLNKIQGDWYDPGDNLILSINDDYINDCKVVGGYDFAGGSSNGVGIFRIAESAGYRNLKIELHCGQGVAASLIFNGETLHQ
jgi:hypothetical protein